MVGAARRLATELVVIIARATQEIHWVPATRVRATETESAAPAGTSAALIRLLDRTSVLPFGPPGHSIGQSIRGAQRRNRGPPRPHPRRVTFTLRVTLFLLDDVEVARRVVEPLPPGPG